jgi:hypothetical protein
MGYFSSGDDEVDFRNRGGLGLSLGVLRSGLVRG